MNSLRTALSAMALTATLSTPALAYEPELMDGEVVNPPTFTYSKATVSNPLRVTVTAEEGNCTFKVSFVGVQRGKALTDGTLNGRIEEGTCYGTKRDKGIVFGYADPAGKRVKMLPSVLILLMSQPDESVQGTPVNP